MEGLAGNLVAGCSLRPVELLVTVLPEGQSLTVEQATPIGLIVNEIVTNSLKHAFSPGKGKGARIEISFHRQEGEYRLTIQDNGRGFGDGAGLSRPAEGMGVPGGLGLSLVAALASQLYASYSLEGGFGCLFTLSFPVIPPIDLAPPDSAR